MIQFNLLPDVKLEYLKAERTRRIVVTVSVLASAASIALLLLLLSVTQLQKKHLNDLSNDIKSDSSKLEGQKDLNKVLTVQNQLTSLTNLHNSKPAATRLFDYLTQVVPSQVDANNLTVDFTQHTMTITGTTDSLSSVNKFVDTLKFTNYTLPDPSCQTDTTINSAAQAVAAAQKNEQCADGGRTTSKPAFTNVVLTGYGLNKDQATYTVTLSYDTTIFDITQDVKLSVPNLVTTRSELDKPNDLFVLPTTNTKAGQ